MSCSSPSPPGPTSRPAWSAPGAGAALPTTPPGAQRGLQPKTWHPDALPDAFFYLIDPRVVGPLPAVVAGASTGGNGSAIVTGLPPGVYTAYADRPGYVSAGFTDDNGYLVDLRLNGETPAVLATIRLAPHGARGLPARRPEAARNMVKNLTNVPNPFRPRTAIRFDLEQDCPVTVQVYDYRGRLVRTLKSGAPMSAGSHTLDWNGTDDNGRRLSAGVYFYRVGAEGRSTSRKMVLLP